MTDCDSDYCKSLKYFREQHKFKEKKIKKPVRKICLFCGKFDWTPEFQGYLLMDKCTEHNKWTIGILKACDLYNERSKEETEKIRRHLKEKINNRRIK